MFDDQTEIEIVKEVVRLAEKKLDAQLTIIGALAQRAGALASVLGGGAAAMLAAEIGILNLKHSSPDAVTFLASLVSPAIAYIGCLSCGRAAGTSTFQTAGNHPTNWKDNKKNEELRMALIGEAENYQKYLQDNDYIISRHARYLRRGLYFGAASPIALAGVSLYLLSL